MRRAHGSQLWLLSLLLPALLGAGTVCADGRISARIDPPVIDELDTARLTIRLSEGNDDAAKPLNLKPLETDFEVLGTQTASRYQSVNGVVESWVDYTITLRPLRTGTLDIPPLTIGGARTTPLTLGVRGVPDEIRAGIDRMVFFELELSRDPVYVRAETVLTRRLYYSGDTQIYSELPGPPEIPDVQIVPVGETRSFPVVRDGLRYGVIEQQFALFPAVAGPLRIPSIALTASVRLMLNGSVRRTGARVRSPERTVNVLPIPPSWPRNTPWLPATDVSITDTWSPDTRTYTVGEPIERTVDIRVTGNLAAAIPPPPDPLPLDLLRQYPEPPALEDDRTGASVTGRRLSQSSLLAVEAGAATVQPVTVTWWDVTADALRVSTGPARNLTLTGAPETRGPETGLPLAGEAATGGAETAEPESDASEAAGEPEPARAPSSTAGPEADGGIWNATLALLQSVPSRVQPLVQSLTGQHAVALAFGLLLAATALLGWRMRRTIGATACALGRTVEATLTAMGLMGTRRGPARRRALASRARRVLNAIERGDAGAALAGLNDWLTVRYGFTAAEAQAMFQRDGGGMLQGALLAARFGPPGENALPDIASARALLLARAADRPGPADTGAAETGPADRAAGKPTTSPRPASVQHTIARGDGLPPLFDRSA